MNPHIQMELADIGPKASHLLLACAFYLFKVVKILSYGELVGDRIENRPGSCQKIAAHKCPPVTPVLTDNQHQDVTSCGAIAGLKHFNLFGYDFPIERRLDRRPGAAAGSKSGYRSR